MAMIILLIRVGQSHMRGSRREVACDAMRLGARTRHTTAPDIVLLGPHSFKSRGHVQIDCD